MLGNTRKAVLLAFALTLMAACDSPQSRTQESQTGYTRSAETSPASTSPTAPAVTYQAPPAVTPPATYQAPARLQETRTASVYIAPYSGKKYHSSPSCRGLNNAASVAEISQSTAQGRGLTPCKICW
ncbi:MAG: hypothetical protein AMXMBFR84_26490 [Candidatus Hydrogenedentota bacterium]